MRKIFPLIALATMASGAAFAQNDGVIITGFGESAQVRNPSAVLEGFSDDQGFLAPRLTQAQRNAIVSPATSLLIFQTDNTPGYYYNSGTPGTPVWERLTVASGVLTGAGTATQVAFWSGPNTLTSNANLFWDNTNGRLGVGTATPAEAFEIFKNGTNPVMLFHASGLASYKVGNDGSIFKIAAMDNGFGGNAGNFASNDVQVLSMSTNGNVGIGNVAPGAKLQIGSFNDNHLLLTSSNNAYGWRIDTRDNGGGSVPLRIFKRTASTDTEVLTILNQNGNVGIGTATPAGKLDIRPANGTASVQFQSSGDAYPRIYMGGTDANVAFVINRLTTSATQFFGEDADAGGFNFRGAGATRISSLAGSGNRVIQADATGNLFASNDIPGGDANYIQNQYAAAQAADYWITGLANVENAYRLDNTNVIYGTGTDVYGNIRVLSSQSTLNDGMFLGYGGTGGPLRFFSNSGTTEFMSLTTAGRLGIGNTAPSSLLHVMGKTNIHQSGAGGGENRFEGLETSTSANGRAQLVLSSAYSDLVVASSNANDNHGSTISMVAYNPVNAANYRKWVINQGNWGARSQFLDFGYGVDLPNPHSAINAGNATLTLNGSSRSVGVANNAPSYPFDVAGKARIRRGGFNIDNSNNGQLEIANTGTGDAFISFHREGAFGAHFGLGADNWFSTLGWSSGGGYTSMRVGNSEAVGYVNTTVGYRVSNAAAAGTYLRGNGTNYVGSAIQAGDLPGGSGNYIQNQNSAVQGANFIISATGRADGDFRAPIFYDQNNTAFYTDPNGSSLLNKIRADANGALSGQWTHDPYGQGWGAPHGSFRSLEVSTSGNFSSEPAMFRIHQWGSGAAEFWKPQGTTLYLRETPGGGGGWFNMFEVQGQERVTGNLYAPIMYDNNNGAYYVDPASTTRLYNLSALAGIDGYYPPNNAIRMTPNLHINNPAGYAMIVNWDNGAVGGGTQQFRVGNGASVDQFYVRADGQFYGRYFADLDNAGYYVDPNGTSEMNLFTRGTLARSSLNALQNNSPVTTRSAQVDNHRNGVMGWGNVDLNTINSNWGAGFFDTWGGPNNGPGAASHYVGMQGSHYNHQDGTNSYGFQMVYAGGTNNRFFWRSGWPGPQAWVEMLHSGNATTLFPNINGDNLGNHSATTTLSMNNNAVVGFGRLEPSGIGGNSGQGAHSYAIFQEGGAWTHPYPDLRIAYHTGIKLGGHFSYGGTRFYNNSDMATLIFSVGDGDNFTRVTSNGGSDGIAMGQIHGDNSNSIQTYIDGQWSNRASYAGGCCNPLLIQPDVGMVAIGTGSANQSYKLHVNGSVLCTTIRSNGFIEPSDARLKENIAPISGALGKILALQGVTYNWNKSLEQNCDLTDNLQYGLIAQELEKVIPELVNTDAEGWKGVEYSHLVPVLIEALKEQQEVIKKHEATITAQQQYMDGNKDDMSFLKQYMKELEARIEGVVPSVDRLTTGNK